LSDRPIKIFESDI